MATLVKSILEQVLALQDDWRFTLLSNWPKVIGPLHEQMRVERITGDVVIMGVYDAHWMQELFLLSRTLMRTINTYLGKQYVQKIQFKLVEKKQAFQHITKEKSQILQKPARGLTRAEEEALHAIRDAELKLVLKSFLESVLRVQ